MSENGKSLDVPKINSVLYDAPDEFFLKLHHGCGRFFFMEDFINNYKGVLLALGVISALLFFLSLLLIPFLLIRIPEEYFAEKQNVNTGSESQLRFTQIIIRIIKNISGVILLLCGIAMLLLPGQGILTILLAMTLIDFPYKRRLECWLISRPVVIRNINRLRKKAGVPPLKI